MGKPNNDAATGGENNGGQNCGCCNASRVCNRSVLKTVIAVILSASILLVGVYNLPMLSNHNGGRKTVGDVPVQAKFTLERPLATISANVLELESDLWDEIGVPTAKAKVISLRPLAESNRTEVVFGVFPLQQNSSISSASLSLLRRTFISLVLEENKLKLLHSVFGRPYFFQVLKYPGGITVIPEQAHFPLLNVQVLFNFTLHNSIVQVVENLAQLKQQLQTGLHVRPTENLFVQLTNLEGSTVEPQTIIETSILPVYGRALAIPRLKQLAQEITGNHEGNLGLNHTLFGKVKQIMLSSYLKDPTSSPSPVPSPAPSPSECMSSSPMTAPISSPSPAPSVPDSQYQHAMAPFGHHCHHHHDCVHSKCGHRHHSRHGPVHGVNGSPSPAPSHAKNSRRNACIHHHVVAAPIPAIMFPPSFAPSPQNVPPSKARPCHSHLPSFPLHSPSPTPSLSGSQFMPQSPTFQSHSPSHASSPRSPSHIARAPATSAGLVSSPKSSQVSPSTLPFSSAAIYFVPPIQLITWSVLLVGTLLTYFFP